MKILSVEVYKGSTYEVEFYEGGKIYLNSEIVRSKELKGDMELSRGEVAGLMYAQQYRKARERALYIIESGDISYQCLYQKLEKNYSQRVCRDICDKMVSIGLIDDRRYGEKLARKYFISKKFGYYRAKREMRGKGIPEKILDELCEEYREDSIERLGELVERKYERYLTDQKGVNKVKSALVRMGYSYDEINKLLDEYELDF